MRGLPITAVYTSPLQRAVESAKQVCAGLGIPQCPQVAEDLSEVHLPGWEGLTYQEVHQRYPEAYACWKQTPSLLSLPTAEGSYHPLCVLYHQAHCFWTRILTQHKGETVLLVAHSGTIRALISTAVGVDLDRYSQFQQSNCGISVVRFPEGEVRACLHSFNQTTHLGESLPKLKEGKRGLRLLLCPANDSLSYLSAPLAWNGLDMFLTSTVPDTTSFLQELQREISIWQDVADLEPNVLTVLMLAPSALIVAFLAATFALKSVHIRGMSVIHCPHKSQAPILQSFNIALESLPAST
ncbi:MAG: histidine phosphatase family protein [Synechococcaceae cyanobacterium SM2_3_1]|nr:histidine phosphatase family protein [Synechococcaceae cyanobacterium SM2_3_1]